LLHSREALFARAYAAHRLAQGGGSGVDIAASVWGGILRFHAASGERPYSATPAALPAGVQIVGYFSGASASTRSLLAAVREFAASQPASARACMRALCVASEDCATPALTATEFVHRISVYVRALMQLGHSAAAPIVPASFAALAACAAAGTRSDALHATFVGAGAGGGDLGLYVGINAPGPDFDALSSALGFERIALTFGAPGATTLTEDETSPRSVGARSF
jgi:phosphomevalonate kinase